jgi:hypothetical protein
MQLVPAGQNNQNVTRALSCRMRGVFAWPVILPNDEEEMFVDGAEKLVRLKILNASA